MKKPKNKFFEENIDYSDAPFEVLHSRFDKHSKSFKLNRFIIIISSLSLLTLLPILILGGVSSLFIGLVAGISCTAFTTSAILASKAYALTYEIGNILKRKEHFALLNAEEQNFLASIIGKTTFLEDNKAKDIRPIFLSKKAEEKYDRYIENRKIELEKDKASKISYKDYILQNKQKCNLSEAKSEKTDNRSL